MHLIHSLVTNGALTHRETSHYTHYVALTSFSTATSSIDRFTLEQMLFYCNQDLFFLCHF